MSYWEASKHFCEVRTLLETVDFLTVWICTFFANYCPTRIWCLSIVLSTMRMQISELLHFLLAISGVFMAWRAISLIVDSPHPILVVISESMAPAFHRGDIIILWNRVPQIKAGDIPVVWFADQKLPMVHRAIEVHWHSENDDTR